MQIALTIATSFQEATFQADEKARGVAAAYLALSTAAATQAGQLVEADGLVAGIIWPAAALFVLAFLAGGYWLVQANRPRLPLVDSASRFSFPDVARAASVDQHQPKDMVTMTEDARRWGEVLARIAVAKNHNVVRALLAVSLMFLLSLLYLAVISVSS
ncbi:hypothetical protein [Kineosporia mesophila]|nr:hypothetical protein [Kineosporia mesophila]MCD5353242.1 hypothetical protein [Kineosporia mesophila]